MVEQIEWIDATVDLPDEDVTVLVIDGDGDCLPACLEYSSSNRHRWILFEQRFVIDGVTHWAHMPVGPGQS